MNTIISLGFPEAILAAGGLTLEASTSLMGLAIALLALSAMEIVLGIDNIVFISIATNKLPEEQRKKARLIGLALAMGFRILLNFVPLATLLRHHHVTAQIFQKEV